MVVTEQGLLLPGVEVWLERGGETIGPHFNTDKGKSFGGEAGQWFLHAEYPGYKSVRKKVTLKDVRQYNTQEILEPVVITMAK